MVYPVPKLVIEDGKPVAVQLDLAEYEALLERLEDQEDLEAIRAMTDADWETISWEDYQAGASGDVPG
ncbi:MAG: type II toxin-antitoxin system Phd/YefM family antitoxin [Planctomycetota bacterium]